MSYAYAGVSKLNGKFKVRFANDQLRVKVLAKNGHKDIDIVQLKHPMSKVEAVEYLLSINFDNGNKEVRAALEAGLETRLGNKDAPKKETKKPKKNPVKVSPSMDAIKAKAQAAKAKSASTVTKAEIDAQLEDAPF
jgi:hypothetical protein